MDSPQSRVVLASRRLVEQRVWQAAQLELEDVIAAVDDVAWCLPGPHAAGTGGRVARGVLNRAGRSWGRPRRSSIMQAPALTEPVPSSELLFLMCPDASGIGMLPHISAHAAAAGKKIAWIMELWGPQLPVYADYLRQLRGFDHVIVSNRHVVEAVEALTGVPCSYLPMAVDTDRYAPRGPDSPPRTVDVASWGRRLPGTHGPLVQALADGRLYYHYDTVDGADVTDHVQHRLAQAALLQRTRFSVVYRINDEPGRIDRTGGEESLTNRYFEALAAGTVMLGSAPDTEEWSDAFPWPDAVVPIPAPAPGIVGVVEELARDPERWEKARRAAVSTFLHRHDWAHRWRDVLALAGMPEHPRLAERLARLEDRARPWDHPEQG